MRFAKIAMVSQGNAEFLAKERLVCTPKISLRLKRTITMP